MILCIVLLDAVAANMMALATPGLLTDLGAGGEVERTLGYLVAVFALAQFLSLPFFGKLSDRWGRRPVLLASIAVLCLDNLVAAVTQSLPVLFVSRAIAGLCAGNFATAFAFVSDTAPAHQRARRFGLVSAAFGLGAVSGPLLAGVLGEQSVRAPYWASALLSGVSLLVCFSALPESLPKRSRSAVDWRAANALLTLWRFAGQPMGLRVGLVFTLVQVARATVMVSFLTYGLNALGWSMTWVGGALSAAAVTQFLVHALLVGVAVGRFGETGTVVLGTSLGAVGYGLFAASGSLATVGAAILLASLATISGPALKALASQRTSDGEQGQLQGVFGSLATACWAIGALLSAVVLPLGDGHKAYPWLFCASMALLLVATAIALVSFPQLAPIEAEADEATV